MKKLVAFVVVLLVGLCCKKEDELVCGCSIYVPQVSFIIKNAQNADLLDQSVTGSFSRSALKLRYLDKGVMKDIAYDIAPPFTYNSVTFKFNQVRSAQLATLRISDYAREFYIDFGNGDTDTLTFDFDKFAGAASNVKLNNKTVLREPSIPETFGYIFYLLK
ncbi:hypothetical protein [Hufsiella ginkgonis]|uniref:Uncharacterized protein n=1 Tax=Hufsiella ginkgonis TaxID=2695274 RepID=A0A7K1Y054_9SPHI|nr:hypothetical protein [Hufsiella ginkgonis]MXV16572.1 hypothetical protein [Hufsiella ginkgonis]